MRDVHMQQLLMHLQNALECTVREISWEELEFFSMVDGYRVLFEMALQNITETNLLDEVDEAQWMVDFETNHNAYAGMIQMEQWTSFKNRFTAKAEGYEEHMDTVCNTIRSVCRNHQSKGGRAEDFSLS